MDVLELVVFFSILFPLIYLCFLMNSIRISLKTIKDDLSFLRKGSRASQWKKD